MSFHQQHHSSPDVIFCDESFVDREQAELEYIRRQIVRALMRKDQDKALFISTRTLIKDYMQKKGETTQEFFRKNREFFCVHLAQKMLENLFFGNRPRPKGSVSTDEPMAKSPRFDLFESWMETLTKLLGFYYAENANLSISNFVENISDCLVPVFVLCLRRYKHIAELFVDQMCQILRLDRTSLIYQHWDDIFEQWILLIIREPSTTDIDVYLYHWLKNNKVEYFTTKTFRSLFRALLLLSLDEHFVLSLVKQIHQCSFPNGGKNDGHNVDHHNAAATDATFSLSMAIRNYFPNILFQFRNAISAVHMAERSKMATKSLEVLIDRVDADLINENAQILMIVLKSAIRGAETDTLCVPAWLKFVQKLRTNMFVSLASQVLMFIAPLLRLDSSKALFVEFFVIRATELSSSATESAKVYNILLAMFNNTKSKLAERLPENLSLKLSTEPPFRIVKSAFSQCLRLIKSWKTDQRDDSVGCAELLLSGMVDLYQIVLQRLLTVLNECDLLQIDASQLARALIFALHRVHNATLCSMIGKCVGIIGLLDLEDRTSSSRLCISPAAIVNEEGGIAPAAAVATDNNNGTSAEIVSVENKVQFTVNFIEDIFATLGQCEQSETAVKMHSVIYYILLCPLKEHGMDEEVWRKLGKNVVEALKASRQNPFQIPVGFKIDIFLSKNNNDRGEQNPIIDQSCNFHQWVRSLYDAICEKLEDNLLRTLFASLCCVDHVAIVSKTMCKNFPHMIIQALIEQNEAILGKFEQETLAVFSAVVGDRICWANDAMVAVCAIVDAMERFFVCRSTATASGGGRTTKDKDVVCDRFYSLINKILAAKSAAEPPHCPAGDVPMSVLASQKCNYHFRSLRWLEQFAAPQQQQRDNDGIFRRDFYFLLERLYSHLGNADGVLGTFQVIRNHTVPEPMEQILALKVQGNYVDALPLCQSLAGQENETVKCLLRSNQPLLARTFIEHTLRQIDQQQQQQHANPDDVILVDGDELKAAANGAAAATMASAEDKSNKCRRRRLREYQMEAVCKLGDWDQLALLQRQLMQEHNAGNSNNAASSSSSSSVAVDVPPHSSVDGVQNIEKWGAKIASIFCNLRQFEQKSLAENIECVRASLVAAVQRTTMEDSSTIAQTQRNIIKLRSLYEVESVRRLLYLGGDKPALLRKLIAEWERQSASSLSFAGRSERVLSLRTELLRVIDLPNTAHTQCRLLLKCSALAREANYLQRAWTYIAEAKALRRVAIAGNERQHGDDAIAIDMEEAKYLFQKGEQFQAINLLDKAVHTNFADLCMELCRVKDSTAAAVTAAVVTNSGGAVTPKRVPPVVVVLDENGHDTTAPLQQHQNIKNSFVEAQMLLADFNERAGAKQMDDLLSTYNRLEHFGHLSEAFYYRYATFYDGYCESATEITSEMICTLIRLYRCVLEFGPLYVNHAMPRMLSVWLDLAPKCAIAETMSATGSAVGTARTSATKRGAGKAAAAAVVHQPFDPNREMREAFKRLDNAYFFSSYAHMVSRITHPNAATYALLKEMLSDLIVRFPHRCLWLSLSIARSTRVAVRSKRCVEIFELAKKKARTNVDTTNNNVDLNLLIQQYDYLATLLLGIAETQIAQQRLTELSVARFFPAIVDFFEKGTMRTTRGVSRSPLLGGGGKQPQASPKATTNRPQLLLPFFDGLFGGFSPAASAANCSAAGSGHAQQPTNNHCGGHHQIREEVFIHGVDPNFECLKSLEAPKKMAFIGTDGRTYPLLCKQNDDLCKDSRFMDVNRMLNMLFLRDSDTRNQLYIRCYSAIPLKEAGGGIIQWVPNLVPFASALKGLMRKRSSLMTHNELQRLLGEHQTTGDRVKAFRDQVCARHPLAMAQWLRTNFLDACSWYNARLAFTRTAAAMSMVGFLLGLGDRHGENMLLDVKTGDLVHVDFNILFDKGEYLKVPEIVPFRLTRNMVDGFGATGVEGTFRKSCEKALKVMRAESRMLGTVLHAFAHDPLLEWTTTEARNQQYRQYGGTVLQPQDNASNTIGMIKKRLAGHIVTARFNPPKACAVPMSVGGQVARLIEIATDETTLSAMYIGWSAFI